VNLAAAALLGVVQGLTEFLPVSSSAHLILARAFFGWDAEQLGLTFDVACHVGTLLAVMVFFRRELTAMALSGPAALGGSREPPAVLLRLIVAGTVPVVIVGVLFADAIEAWARTPQVAAAALALGGVVLLAAERMGARVLTEERLTLAQALVLGVAQSAALVPGVSRSGATIAIALFMGVRRDSAARFSFLLGVPAILAAAGKTALDLRGTHLIEGDALLLFATGIVTSAVVGYATVKYFLRYVAGHRLDTFAWYRIALAACVPIWIALK
jgi:undecaprenyl-diphosphatase